jgi:hypothetical protein
MSFNQQPYIFFGMFISYKCDGLHLKLDILNPLNISFQSNGLINEFFALQPFPFKFQDFEKKQIIWFFIKFIQWTCTFIKGGMFLFYTKFEINCMSLCMHFDSLFKKNFKHLIILVYRTQNDTYIISKLFWLI